MKKQSIRPWLLVAATAFALQATADPETKTPKTIKYIDQANMDPAVKPGDNFYLYANGTWLKNNAVPASKTRWGSFDIPAAGKQRTDAYAIAGSRCQYR